jgi:hypothetical protein
MSTAICHVYGQFDQTGDRLACELDFLDRLGIPADISVRLRPDPRHIPRLTAWAAHGRLVAPSIYPPDLDPACRDANWWAYDASECQRLLGIAREQMRAQGLDELEAITTYTPGNGLIEACRQRGIRYLLGFCAPTVINDGHWQITHSGAPLGPYLASADDFRRPAASEDAVLVSSMELRNPMTCAEHWSEGPFCPLNLVMGDRTIETGELPLETIAACEDWIRLSELTGTARWFHLNLQWFTSPRCFDLNRRCLEWLANQARMGRIRFATLRERRETLLKAGGVADQSTWWRGSCMGQTIGGQPAGGVDCIVHESPAGQWQFRRGEAGARRHYAWTREWRCRPFDPLGMEPHFDCEQATIHLENTEILSDGCLALTLRWTATGPGRICAWEALAGLRPPFQVSDSSTLVVEALPHPGGSGGALLIEIPAAAGTVRLVLRHGGRASSRHSADWAGLARVETTVIDNRPLTRIAPQVPARFHLPLGTTCNHHVRWECIDGGTATSGMLAPGERTLLPFDGRKGASVVRLWDASAADLAEPVEELAGERARLLASARADASLLAPLLPPPDAPLAFAAEDVLPAWAVAAAQAAADVEIAAAEQIAVRLGSGIRLAALHCAADLVPGTKGRVRSQRHDRQERAGPEEFFAIYYDYGQCHGFGITGWNQFWQIDLGLRGLQAGGSYRLVLNIYDPEDRGGAARILARPCDSLGHATSGSTLHELRAQRPLAQGLSARHADQAFVAIDVPPALASADAIDIAIRSHSEAVRYDRREEGYGYIFLAHAWLFAR